MPSCHWPMSPLWTRRNAKVPAAPRSLGQGSALLHYGGVQEPIAAADWRAKSIGASPPCEWKAVEGFLPPPPLSAKNLLQQPTYPMAGLPPCIIGRCRVGLVYDCALLPFSFFLFPFLFYIRFSIFRPCGFPSTPIGMSWRLVRLALKSSG